MNLITRGVGGGGAGRNISAIKEGSWCSVNIVRMSHLGFVWHKTLLKELKTYT